MGLPQADRPFLQPQDYLAWEAGQAERHEYVDGEVYAMTGARDAHNRIALNVAAWLKSALRGTPCRTFISDMKVQIALAESWVYPDVLVSCDERDRAPDADLAKRHPVLVVEVLSSSTGAYDRGRKFELYRSLPSLREYLLIEQDRMQVDLFRRNADDRWELYPAGRADTLQLASLGLQLPVALIYDDIEFEPEPPPPPIK